MTTYDDLLAQTIKAKVKRRLYASFHDDRRTRSGPSGTPTSACAVGHARSALQSEVRRIGPGEGGAMKMRRRVGIALAGLFVALVAASCSSAPPFSACTPGESVACTGVAACAGGQACLPDGSGFGACECGSGGIDSGSVDSSVASDGSITPPMDAALEAGKDAALDAAKDAAPDAPADAGPPDTVVQVSVAGYTNCFRFASGKVRCVGWNDDKPALGEGPMLGDGLASHAGCPIAGTDCSFKPVIVSGLTDAIDLGAGAYHSCVRKSDSTVVCWGRNYVGQIGDGTLIPRATPTPVSGLVDVVQLAVGANVTCARKSTGVVVCWGQNNFGQVGDGTVVTRSTPTPVAGLTDAIDVSIGDGGACAIRAGGQLVCWGINQYGDLGDGVVFHKSCEVGLDCSPLPVAVSGITDATQISRGAAHACAVRADGSMWCWGLNNEGGLGDGVPNHGNYPTWTRCQDNDCQPTPVKVVNMAFPKQIAVGAGHTCALRPTGVVSCWGAGDFGSLGGPKLPNGEPEQRYVPGDVTGIADALSLSGKFNHDYCALRPNGRVTCWGRNVYGELANGNHSNTFGPTDVLW